MLSPNIVRPPPWITNYLGLIALSILPLSGCGYVSALTSADKTALHDMSTGIDAATIKVAERQPFDPICGISQDENLYNGVIVDAGAVVMQVKCSRVTGVFGERTEQLGRANLAFEAEAGQQYRVALSEDFGFPHIAVTTAIGGAPVIHRGLLESRSAANASLAHVTLVARSGAGVIPCKFGRPWTDRTRSSVRRPAGTFVHVPYSHQIVAECSTYAYVTGDVEQRYEAPVDFEPVSGRIYTVHMDENNPHFVFVTDVSSAAKTIAHVRAVRTH